MGYERNDRRYGYQGDRGSPGGYGYGAERDRGYGRADASGRADADRGDYGSRRDYRDYRGNDREYGRQPSGYDYQDRGFFDRAGDEVRSWFGDEEAERRRRWDERNDSRYRDDYRSDYYSGAAGVGVGDPYGAGDYGRNYGASGRGRDDRGQQRHHDPSYSSWRDRQIQAFDRDYDDYRRENQSKFDTEFHSWRQTRQGQRDLVNKVQEHQEVVGSDGAHVGTVDHVRGDRIELTRSDKDAGGRHHTIPANWVQSVDDKVTLNRTADQAKQQWRDEQRNEGGLFGSRDEDRGAHNLNRSFSGTY